MLKTVGTRSNRIGLYTDFPEAGKLEHPTAEELARRAIQSVQNADAGKDGISYPMGALASGIETPLTQSYRSQILEQKAFTFTPPHRSTSNSRIVSFLKLYAGLPSCYDNPISTAAKTKTFVSSKMVPAPTAMNSWGPKAPREGLDLSA